MANGNSPAYCHSFCGRRGEFSVKDILEAPIGKGKGGNGYSPEEDFGVCLIGCAKKFAGDGPTRDEGALARCYMKCSFEYGVSIGAKRGRKQQRQPHNQLNGGTCQADYDCYSNCGIVGGTCFTGTAERTGTCYCRTYIHVRGNCTMPG